MRERGREGKAAGRWGGRSALAAVIMAGLPGCAGDPDLPEPPPVRTAPGSPPPVSGGTLTIDRNGHAVFADPDRDRVLRVDLADGRVLQEIALERGDEPGRVVEAADGRIHVVLRRGDAVATIEEGRAQAARTPVCVAPRGIAELDGQLHVACQDGQLWSLDASSLAVTRRLRVAPDLRDLVVAGGRLVVSRFRAAELLTIDDDGTVAEERVQPPPLDVFGTRFQPSVAYRTIALPDGRVAMVHQRALATGETPLAIQPGGYYSGIGCDNTVVNSTVSIFGPSPDPDRPSAVLPPVVAAASLSAVDLSVSFGTTTATNGAVLAIDVAISPQATRAVVVSSGNDEIYLSNTAVFESFTASPCGAHQPIRVFDQPIAAAFADEDTIVVATRAAPMLKVLDAEGRLVREFALPGVDMQDTGHDFFHRNLNGASPVACASCHPEGGEDGRVWNVFPLGNRRTQHLGGGLATTLPLHWDGSIDSMTKLVDDVFVGRMGGKPQGPRQVAALSGWLDTVPSAEPPPARDPDAVARGRELFESETVGCATCHGGPQFTNNTTVDVGTGRAGESAQAFQVPSLLGLAARAPYLHDGCAPTLEARFTDPACSGGDRHGRTSQLGAAAVADLVAYLETL